MSLRVFSLGLALVAAMQVACGTPTVPLSARAGSSFSLALVGEKDAGEAGAPDNNVGFGSTQYWTEGIVDVQRGEVEFFLVDAGSNEVLLETQFVTRVFPDPASELGVQNGVVAAGNVGLGQVIAVVFIPVTVLPDLYTLRARKILRDAAGAPPLATLETLTYAEPFEVLPAGPFGAPHYEKTRPFLSYGGFFVNGQLFELYPYPKVVVNLPASPVPSAGHVVVSVPSNVTVRSVVEEQHTGRVSVVTWSEQNGQVMIDFANLESPPKVGQLAIAYAPGVGYQRIDGSAGNTVGDHFPIDAAATMFWDADGIAVAGAATLGPIR